MPKNWNNLNTIYKEFFKLQPEFVRPSKDHWHLKIKWIKHDEPIKRALLWPIIRDQDLGEDKGSVIECLSIEVGKP